MANLSPRRRVALEKHLEDACAENEAGAGGTTGSLTARAANWWHNNGPLTGRSRAATQRASNDAGGGGAATSREGPLTARSGWGLGFGRPPLTSRSRKSGGAPVTTRSIVASVASSRSGRCTATSGRRRQQGLASPSASVPSPHPSGAGTSRSAGSAFLSRITAMAGGGGRAPLPTHRDGASQEAAKQREAEETSGAADDSGRTSERNDVTAFGAGAGGMSLSADTDRSDSSDRYASSSCDSSSEDGDRAAGPTCSLPGALQSGSRHAANGHRRRQRDAASVMPLNFYATAAEPPGRSSSSPRRRSAAYRANSSDVQAYEEVLLDGGGSWQPAAAASVWRTHTAAERQMKRSFRGGGNVSRRPSAGASGAAFLERSTDCIAGGADSQRAEVQETESKRVRRVVGSGWMANSPPPADAGSSGFLVVAPSPSNARGAWGASTAAGENAVGAVDCAETADDDGNDRVQEVCINVRVPGFSAGSGAVSGATPRSARRGSGSRQRVTPRAASGREPDIITGSCGNLVVHPAPPQTAPARRTRRMSILEAHCGPQVPRSSGIKPASDQRLQEDDLSGYSSRSGGALILSGDEVGEGSSTIAERMMMPDQHALPGSF